MMAGRSLPHKGGSLHQLVLARAVPHGAQRCSEEAVWNRFQRCSDGRPWLSVVMPTYNGERFLQQSLASIAAQCDPNIEVVAVDDGSTDATIDILRRWSKTLALTIIERAHFGNWVATTAAGMASANGRYLCWLHQDDTWCAGRAAKVRRAAAAHPSAALIVHPCWYTDACGRRIGYWHTALPRRGRLLSFGEVAAPLLVQCSIASCGALFRANAASVVGAPDATLRYHADWDYWLRLAKLGGTLHMPTPLASFRIHPASQTIALAGDADARLMEARTVLRRHLPLIARRCDAKRVERVATVSAEINHVLNSLLAGRTGDLRSLVWQIAAIGPAGWLALSRDARLFERCLIGQRHFARRKRH